VLPIDDNWFFEAVFDYGEHDLTNPKPDDSGKWAMRNHPFSSYRAGFEVRTYRLCRRVLMFHHFQNEDGVGQNCLVRSTDFTYTYEEKRNDTRDPIYSFLHSVSQTGYKRNPAGGYIQKSLPPLEFTYSQPDIDETVRDVDRTSLENLPEGLDGTLYQWVDLDGEGLSGILTEQGNGWFYKRNLSPINAVQDNGKRHVEANFAPVELVASRPASGLGNGGQFLDLGSAMPGFYERTQDAGWENFVPFKSLPVMDWDNPNLKFIDLNGDGHSDILITEDRCFVWHPSLAEDGFAAAERVSQPWDQEKGPRVIFADSTQSIHLADMSGDGLTDIVRIRNGEVCYWPNLGYGRFGAKVTMDTAPWFDRPDIFDQRRIQLADIDGSGTTDILYLSGSGVQVYFNQSGNGWAAIAREHILSQFEHEYFPRWFEDLRPNEVNVLGTFQENVLPQPDLEAEALSAKEWREALRACKGMMLRQEVYEMDVDALEFGEHRPVKLFSTAYHNCHIRRLQAKGQNQHAVFLVAESEAITYHYELDLTQDMVRPDPRIAHTLNLQFDEYANVLQSVAVVYPRLGQFEDNTLAADALALIRQVQQESHLAYSETRYTEDFGTKAADKIAALDNHRLRMPCEVLTYELTGINPKSGLYFTLNEMRAFQLSLVHQKSGTPVPDIPYHQIPNRTTPEKHLVEHTRSLFFSENLVDPLPFGEHGRLGLAYETYKLALTEALLDAVFKDAAGNNKLERASDGATTARTRLNDPAISGYLSGTKLTSRFASISASELSGQYWIRSGIAGFANDAAQHFYLQERYTDPFDNVTTLEYDPRDLFIMSSTDMMTNTTRVTKFDFRVLAPREIQDINNNLSEVYFDVLGLPTVMAVKGKGNEGDNLIGVTDALANPTTAELAKFFNQPNLDQAQARTWLGNATARHLYYFGETEETLADGAIAIRWGQHPACACGIVREQHVSQLAPGEQSPLQASFEYSDGMGSVVVKKVQAKPELAGQPIRWVASGKTILNNKGKPVKQYEPYFSSPAVGHQYEEPTEEGVTPIIYYDAVGRTVRTEMPDGSFSRVEFSPWHVRTFDPNDTVTEAGNAWFASKTAATATPADKRAAKLATEHANTPALTILDSLGRDVISIAHNRVKDGAGVLKDDRYLTFTKLDAEGKPLWIRDARKNLVMQYIRPSVPSDQAADPVDGFVPCYDIAGNLLFQHSMDAGDRWMLNDAGGKPMCAWDNLGRAFRTDYDALHRPVGSFVKGADPANPNQIVQFEKVIYGDTPGNGLSDAQKTQLNLRGKPYQHYDTAGLVVSLGRNPATGAD
jgi:hypothetical protein